MKNLLSAILFLAIISSCQQTATNEEVGDSGPPFEIQDTDPSIYAVSLDSAIASIQYYDSLSKAALGIDPIRAFTIRSVDLVEAMGMDMSVLKDAKYRHVRIYMGLQRSGEFKIYLTPVKGAKLSEGKPGKDVILKGPYRGKKGEDDELGDGDGEYVFDFSQPCPSACDDGSPLNND